MVSAARKKCPVEKRKREGHFATQINLRSNMFPYIPTQTIKNCSEKPSTCFLALDISDNWHICNSYLLIFNWLYRISAKNASIADSCMSTPSNRLPNQSKQPLQLRFVPHTYCIFQSLYSFNNTSLKVCNKLFDRPFSKTKKLWVVL